ncbi:hypothetical protein ECOLIN_23195 [Escherichia coli Nissle 1917]|nr:hypothetical protein ECOLIN_23195 [Escherichia coli Nissle 1917]
MKLALTLEADSVNVQALNMGRIVVDIDGVNLAELINHGPYRHTLQYRTYHGNGQRLAVLAVTPDQ